jgi:predicted nuclease with TOPRIM domain
MAWDQLLINLGGGGGAAALVLASLRSQRVRRALGRVLSDDSDIKESLSSLRLVVEAQGESIEWLRNELDRTRLELEQARDQLRQTETLRQENVQLRARVAELESHVANLEARLHSKETS